MKLIFTPAQLRKMPHAHFVNLIYIKTKITYSQDYYYGNQQFPTFIYNKNLYGGGWSCPHF